MPGLRNEKAAHIIVSGQLDPSPGHRRTRTLAGGPAHGKHKAAQDGSCAYDLADDLGDECGADCL